MRIHIMYRMLHAVFRVAWQENMAILSKGVQG